MGHTVDNAQRVPASKSGDASHDDSNAHVAPSGAASLDVARALSVTSCGSQRHAASPTHWFNHCAFNDATSADAIPISSPRCSDQNGDARRHTSGSIGSSPSRIPQSATIVRPTPLIPSAINCDISAVAFGWDVDNAHSCGIARSICVGRNPSR